MAARLLFLRDHPFRRNVPRGFEAAFQLVLDHLEGGSSVSVLSRVASSALVIGLAQSEVDNYFDTARALVEDTIRCAASGGKLPDLGDRLVPSLSRFGRYLQSNERVYFSPPSGDREDAPFDIALRTSLALRCGDTYWSNLVGSGEIVQVDRPRRRFTVEIDHERLPFDIFEEAQYADAFEWLKNASLVKVEAEVLRDRDGRFKRMNLKSISAAEEEDLCAECSIPLQKQFDTLQALEDGWYGGEGTRYTDSLLDKVHQALSELTETHKLPCPYVYPMPSGGVSAEWSFSKWTVDLVFDLEEGKVHLIATETDGDKEVEREFQFGDTLLEAEDLGSILVQLIKGEGL